MKNFVSFLQEAAQGLPAKNIKLLNGKTLLEHSINCTKRSDLISKIFVSSDSEDLINLKKHGICHKTSKRIGF